MQKFSFIKGLVIGGILSAFFWVGAYYLVTSITYDTTPQEETIQSQEINTVKASF